MTDGRVLYLDLRDATCLTYCLFGEIPTDRVESEIVRSTLQPGETAMDIGAFVGWYSTLFAKAVGRQGAVFAFEPNPTSYRLLSMAARPYPHLEVRPEAVSSHPGRSELHVPRDLHSTSLRATGADRAVQACNVVSVDAFLATKHRRPPIFVKCDAEGAEVAILEGARDFLRQRPAIWMIEICPETASRFGNSPRQIAELFAAVASEPYSARRVMYPSGELVPLEAQPLEGIFNAVLCPASLEQRLRGFCG
jgi:FkbM family methyltransferase